MKPKKRSDGLSNPCCTNAIGEPVYCNHRTPKRSKELEELREILESYACSCGGWNDAVARHTPQAITAIEKWAKEKYGNNHR